MSTATRIPLPNYRDQLEHRSMLVTALEMVPIECVARGYLSGSGWKDYQATGSVCGVKLSPGIRESGLLPEPVFTPATKAESGHDINISFEEASELIGAELCGKLRDPDVGHLFASFAASSFRKVLC